MKLSELISVINQPALANDFEIRSISFDSRKVEPNSLFIAISGFKKDGHNYLEQAAKNGAVALVVERPESVPFDFSGSVFVVPNSREALDKLASQFFQSPSMHMFCFGITGTNGKTSSTYMLEHVLNRLQLPTGVMGTINHHFLDHIWPTEMTTPDPISLQGRLREMCNLGARGVAMEISSHAIDQHRVDEIHFNTVLFTNLTRDHLDYHKDMNSYFNSKQRLFTDLLWKSKKPALFAIINIDDSWGAKLRVATNTSLWTFGQKTSADFSFKVLKMDFSRTDFEIKTPLGIHKSFIPMCGVHNVYNAIGVVAAAASAGVPPLLSLGALQDFPGIPGRLQRVPNNKCLNIFVDYAHSPDALENVLKTLKQVRLETKTSSKIWTIFGCGGDRDKGKRPEMAKISNQHSDFVMITSDNPRTEDPDQIIADIVKGFDFHTSSQSSKIMIEKDRRKSIGIVLSKASVGDVVLIAGKGHENYQVIGDEKKIFSDFEVASEEVASETLHS